ncbi:hypothetical protein ACFV5G_24280 [Streptomyces sp. NPDC059766]|uniref:hypothetical protein n=1 Tax=Streptomyces sp. NPDC059766 TaxID=3346940 RepID=UPI003660203D
MIRTILRGCAAGAAGTTALNAVSYADMTLRGRPASTVPEDLVDTVTTRAGYPLQDTATKDSRLTGLAALTGIALGSGMGVAVSLLHQTGTRMPLWLGGALTGALLMAVADIPIARLGISDPRTWTAADWTSDVVPHLVYGLVTYSLATTCHPQP